MEDESTEDLPEQEILALNEGEPKTVPVTVQRMSLRPALFNSMQLHTWTAETGDLFTYEITQPVDIARSRSALVPILQEDVETETVALYNRNIRERNPLTALRIRNTSGLILEGGPVTIFQGNNYVGEALMETMRKEEVHSLPYSVELGVTVSRKLLTITLFVPIISVYLTTSRSPHISRESLFTRPCEAFTENMWCIY